MQPLLSILLCFKPREEMVLSGKYKSGEQILRLANERFAVPEILFNPSDIGIQEMGIPEAIVYSIQNLPEGALIPAHAEENPSKQGHLYDCRSFQTWNALT